MELTVVLHLLLQEPRPPGGPWREGTTRKAPASRALCSGTDQMHLEGGMDRERRCLDGDCRTGGAQEMLKDNDRATPPATSVLATGIGYTVRSTVVFQKSESYILPPSLPPFLPPSITNRLYSFAYKHRFSLNHASYSHRSSTREATAPSKSRT